MKRSTTTTNTIAVPDSIRVLVRKSYSEDNFRVAKIREEFLTNEEPTRSWEAEEYRVILTGPVVTKSGRDHASQTGERKYTSATSLSGPGLDSIPTDLKGLLLGRDALNTCTCTCTR